jgi:hypothetical protein
VTGYEPLIDAMRTMKDRHVIAAAVKAIDDDPWTTSFASHRR